MNTKKNLAQITKTKNSMFRVKYFGRNGEPLSVSQVENTRNNAKKNIKAMILLGSGSSMEVLDLSGKKHSRFRLCWDGTIFILNLND